MKASQALKATLASVSKGAITEADCGRLYFSLMSDAESTNYRKVAQKQKQVYTKYLSEKRHINVRKLIERRREEKEAGKLSK